LISLRIPTIMALLLCFEKKVLNQPIFFLVNGVDLANSLPQP